MASPTSVVARDTGWSVSLYAGPATNTDFTEFVAGRFHWTTAMLGLAADGRLAYLGWGWSLMGEGQITQYSLRYAYTTASLGVGFEFNHFPWSRELPTSFAIYSGPSFSTDPPIATQWSSKKTLLNYVSIELAVAIPQTQGWDIELRSFHRSGAWGFYTLDDDESTMIGLGIRRRF